jgi:Ni,Fe-hydrogenase I cytochrome b subunit
MDTPAAKPGELKALLIIHRALLTGLLLFSIVAFYLVYSKTFADGFQELDKILQVIAIVLSAGGFYIGTVLFKKKLAEAKELQTGMPKFAHYRAACILQWALIEGPCLFVIVSFLLTGNYAFLALAVVLMLLFTMMAPSKLKIAFQLQLSEQEIAEL